jgi:hypothetical protein
MNCDIGALRTDQANRALAAEARNAVVERGRNS